MTLADLAEASSVSLSHLSAIERGAVNPSLDKINLIADALAVPAAWFFTTRSGSGPLEREHVVRAENRRNLNLVYGEPPEKSGYQDWLLSSSIGGEFYMGISDYAPDAGLVPDLLFTRAGEQHVLVLEGELVLFLESEVITLRAGDSYSIPGELPHHISNKSDRPARAVWVNAPVIIPQSLSPTTGAKPADPTTSAGDGTVRRTKP
ncbi:cupin domain-containing protein [Rhodobacterales bacterium HKCCE3408]|nr:cupin domain-containing protein [Rhodobacterales bacterium HKCCE3408]